IRTRRFSPARAVIPQSLHRPPGEWAARWGDRRLAPPPEATDPHGPPSRLNQGQPVAVPARHLGVDQKCLESALTRLGKRTEAVAALPAANVEWCRKRIGIEGDASAIARNDVPGCVHVTRLDLQADLGQQRHAGHTKHARLDVARRANADADAVAADFERDFVEPEWTPRRPDGEHPAQAAMRPRTQRPAATQAHGGLT